MAQTKKGALLSSAKKAGISVEELIANINAGLKRCTRCKTWKSVSSFGVDNSRHDGKDASCFDCRHVKERKDTKGHTSAFKGKVHTDEAKIKMSQAKKGMKLRLGKKHTEETRKKISESTRERTPKGKDHYNYKHGEAQRNLNDRRKPEYLDWRNAVLERDNYACQKCGDSQGGNLRCHHIKPFSTHPELRFEVSNGITLCHVCHELEHFKSDSIRNQRKLKRGERLWK